MAKIDLDRRARDYLGVPLKKGDHVVFISSSSWGGAFDLGKVTRFTAKKVGVEMYNSNRTERLAFDAQTIKIDEEQAMIQIMKIGGGH